MPINSQPLGIIPTVETPYSLGHTEGSNVILSCDVKSCNETIDIPEDEIDEAGGIKTPNGYKAMLEYIQERNWTVLKYDHDGLIFFYGPDHYGKDIADV